LICTLFRSFLVGGALCTSAAIACNLPFDSLSPEEKIPQEALDRFCIPEEGYTSLLLIQAAINEDSPVFRIIAVKRDDLHLVQGVKLYQFDKDGNAHPDFWGQPQAVIAFERNSPQFEAQVKGKRATVSFGEQTFEFDMGGIFGVRVTQNLNSAGRLTVDQKPTSILLVNTLNRDRWRWIFDDGEQAHF